MEIRRKKKTIDEFWYILIVRTTMNMCWRKEEYCQREKSADKEYYTF
jgi:hypothetical protein